MAGEGSVSAMTRLVYVVAVCFSLAALAIAKGGSLYIAAKDVKLLKDPKAKSATIGAALEIGTEVKWLGASDKDKSFHLVEVNGKKGYVLMSNLTPSKPMREVASDGSSMSQQSFANSGAATKGPFGPSSTPYVPTNPEAKKSYEELQKLEALNKDITAAQLDQKAKDLAAEK
jgi:hypothetical protein